MNKRHFTFSTFILGLLCMSTVLAMPSTQASVTTYDIQDFLGNVSAGSSYGNDIQDYVELSSGYMQMAELYKDEACDEADAAEAARQAGDYEAFEEHMENAQEAAELAQEAATQAQAYADVVRELAEAAVTGSTDSGSTTTPGGLDIEWSWVGPSGLGNTYDFSDIENNWEDLLPRWTKEDLMGYPIDPTIGMEYPQDWDFEIYIDPEYWAEPTVIMEDYYGTGRTEAYYEEALDFYENLLVGEDLYEFQNNADYHDFLINSYVNTYLDTPAYQSVMTESYITGVINYESYFSNIAGQVSGYDMVQTETLGPDLQVTPEMIDTDSLDIRGVTSPQMLQSMFNFRF